MDTIRGVPALADSDPAALIGQYSRDLRTWLYGDTGWQDCTLASGIVASGGITPGVRRIGAVVYLRGAITNATLSAGSAKAIGTVPAGFQPDAWSYYMSPSNTPANTARLVVKSNGEMEITTPSTLGTYFTLNVLWVLG